MKFEVYDKAKWHYESKDMPNELPEIAGATHIAFFVRWCVEHDLMSREIEEDCAEELQQIKDKELDCRDFFFDDMDGVLTSNELNTKGKQFAAAYEGMELAKGVIGKAENQLDNLKSEYDSLVNDGIISSASDIERLGVIAWDAGRLNFVARAAMQKGYLTQEECQHCVDHAYEMSLSARFNSWKDFANSYMLGRVMWNGDNNMGALAEDLLTKPNSPWVRFPWKSGG